MRREENPWDGRVKIRYFSWAEYIGVLFAFGGLASLPGILYGGWENFTGSLKHYGLWYLLYWILITFAFCAMTAYQKHQVFDRPMRQLSKATERVASGDFSVYLEPVQKTVRLDYISAIFQDFNKMVAELGSIETMKNDFIANVSHEIKTPLSVIRNYTELLKDPDLHPDKRAEYIDSILSSTDRLSALVTNILKLNKLESRQILPKPEPFDLCRQLSDCALHLESLWEEKNIRFEAEIEDRALIFSDPDMLELVWNNLLSNALKFTEPGGSVTLRQTSDADTVTVTVSDSGCGMGEETMKHIFEKFYQGDTSHAQAGNGLGLALAYRVVDQLNGTLTVSSRLGKGSAFTVRLPVHPEGHGNGI